MSKATYPLKLPASIKAAAARPAKQDGVSLNQWIATAVAQKIGAVETATDFFRHRAGDARPNDLMRIMDKVPAAPPPPEDHLSLDLADRLASANLARPANRHGRAMHSDLTPSVDPAIQVFDQYHKQPVHRGSVRAESGSANSRWRASPTNPQPRKTGATPFDRAPAPRRAVLSSIRLLDPWATLHTFSRTPVTHPACRRPGAPIVQLAGR